MKLLMDEMNKRWILYNEFELNKEFIKAIWIFYSLYDISLALCKLEDKTHQIKNKLILRYITHPTQPVYNRIKNMMIKDVETINKAMRIVENAEGGGVQKGDYKKPGMFAISIYE